MQVRFDLDPMAGPPDTELSSQDAGEVRSRSNGADAGEVRSRSKWQKMPTNPVMN